MSVLSRGNLLILDRRARGEGKKYASRREDLIGDELDRRNEG